MSAATGTAGAERIDVLIVDDQALVRTGFRLVLEIEPDLRVVGEAADGEAAVARAAELQPDVVLMDVRMPGVDGIEATRRLTAGGNAPRVVMLTTFDMDEYVYDALRAGASGFLLKDTEPELLVAGLRAVHRGEALLGPTVVRRLIESYLERPRAVDEDSTAAALARLTERERETLRLLAEGLTNAEIAQRLYVAETTVKTHVGRVLMKLDLRDRVHAVIYAYETGLVTGPSR
ncbi:MULTISPECIES: response regulator transcription factor [unclassified Actinotalea]|uniref:response regulator n=1 Tax=unclassified Actinotalea TaxID=2638618 RepID=UPI0015F71C1A|nr:MULTISPECIES: response regulator transcription factor [unclassified Actinotalea]